MILRIIFQKKTALGDFPRLSFSVWRDYAPRKSWQNAIRYGMVLLEKSAQKTKNTTVGVLPCKIM